MEKFLEENKWTIGLVIVGSILIGLEKGYLDANNEYHRLASKRTRLEGQDFLIMAQAITTGSSLYNEIKSSLYSILQAKGEVAGTVS